MAEVQLTCLRHSDRDQLKHTPDYGGATSRRAVRAEVRAMVVRRHRRPPGKVEAMFDQVRGLGPVSGLVAAPESAGRWAASPGLALVMRRVVDVNA